MALTGLVSLTEAQLNKFAEQAQQTKAAPQVDTITKNAATATSGDEFTFSAQNAELGDALPTSAPFLPAVGSTLAANVTAALAKPNAPVAAPSTAEQLQTLNNSLQELGLSRTNISKIDFIASMIGNFNPEAYTIIANELKAQQDGPRPAATANGVAQTRAARA